ncbi:MAG: TrkA family potassium uptake protein [Lentisphaeria bacterium]|nr:TrkA family potassium uptake protein [Lentisphaeria bacterium]
MRRIGIIGGGRFGTALAESLTSQGIEVVLLDEKRQAVELLAPTVAKAIIGDATSVEALVEAGMKDCDAVVVTISENMEASILATMALKEIGIPYVVARAFSEMHGRVLEKVGADRIVYPARDMALRLAKSLVASSVHDYVEVAEGISVLEVPAPKHWYGKSLIETGIRTRFGVMVLAIKRWNGENNDRKSLIAPAGDDTIKERDTLVVFGADTKLQTFEKDIIPE